jgi:hypothetical protein
MMCDCMKEVEKGQGKASKYGGIQGAFGGLARAKVVTQGMGPDAVSGLRIGWWLSIGMKPQGAVHEAREILELEQSREVLGRPALVGTVWISSVPRKHPSQRAPGQCFRDHEIGVLDAQLKFAAPHQCLSPLTAHGRPTRHRHSPGRLALAPPYRMAILWPAQGVFGRR